MIVYYDLVEKRRYESGKRNMRADQLLKFLESGPKTFGQMEETLDLWPATLTRLLNDLDELEMIRPIRHQKKQAYSLTKKGLIDVQKTGLLGMNTIRILENGGVYFEDYSGMQGTMWGTQLSWGTMDDLVLDKRLKKINPITKETAKKIQEVLYNLIREDIKKRKITIDNTTDGSIIFGFQISYKDLIKSTFEQSLEYLDNISKRELDLLDKMDSSSISEKELKEFKDIRKKTQEKLHRSKK